MRARVAARRYLRFWREGARALHFERLKAKIEQRMFFAKPDFCYAIMEIGAKVRWTLPHKRSAACRPGQRAPCKQAAKPVLCAVGRGRAHPYAFMTRALLHEHRVSICALVHGVR